MSMFTILFVNFISAVGITIVAPILGIAGQIFEVDQGYAMWLMTGFMMAYASFMPMIGRMSDNFGRKKVFIASASIFSFGLLLSFLSNDFNIVILGRMIQGFGAGGILPVANAMAVELYQDSKGKALALVNATYGLGVVVGVNLGGIIYDHLGWKWMFIVPFILTLIVIPIAVSFLKETLKFKKHEAIDYIGSILFAAAIISFMFMMKYLAVNSFFSPEVLVPMIAMVISFILFVTRELKVENPVIDMRDFKNPSFLIYSLIAFFFGFSMFLFVTFLPSFTQTMLGYGVSESVYAIDPFAIAMIFFVMLGGILIKRFGARKSMVIGALLFASFSYLFVKMVDDGPSFYIYSILLASGLGISMTPMNYVIMEEGGKEKQGVSAGIASVMRSLGGIVGPTIAGIIIANVDFSSIFVMDNLIKAYMKIFSISFYSTLIQVALSILGLFAFRKILIKGGIRNEKI
ncbi:MFS transporter [Kosmotoga sp. DU53]|nr:MFS transporter [Kosmotoga sp. DU53]OAA25043.1 hypothetical protein DU53_00530 [Kosmotoga sp. DU53]